MKLSLKFSVKSSFTHTLFKRKPFSPSPQIAKDAKECVQECVSEFISFITSEASERCHQEKRKTINGEDILFAMSTLGFDMYVEPLEALPAEVQRGNIDILVASSCIIEVKRLINFMSGIISSNTLHSCQMWFPPLDWLCSFHLHYFVWMFSGHERRERHKQCNSNRRHGRGADRRDFQ